MLTIVGRFFICLLTAVVVAVCGLLGVIYVLEKGPSVRARDLFVVSMNETSAAKFVPTIFLTQEEVDEILAKNSFQDNNVVTDTDLVVISKEPVKNAEKDESIDPDGDGIDILEISGSTFKGKLMLVYDPSRVFLGISGSFGPGLLGKTLPDLYNSYDNVVAAVNGGLWDDRAGHGSGSEPVGVVISEGKGLCGDPWSWDIAGMTYDNKLVVGTYTVQQALDAGIRDAVYFGPALVVNGEPLEALGTGSGLNPRTAIGQRADGTIMLMTIDGRQGNSLGASLTDVRDMMVKYGAMNAYNLDGGSSTNMIYNGEIINNGASLVGLRRMPTAWLVRGE